MPSSLKVHIHLSNFVRSIQRSGVCLIKISRIKYVGHNDTIDQETRVRVLSCHVDPCQVCSLCVAPELYEQVPGNRQWWIWIVFVHLLQGGLIFPRSVAMVSDWTGLPGNKVWSALSNHKDWITDSGGYVDTNSLCALIAGWLKSSQKCRDGV